MLLGEVINIPQQPGRFGLSWPAISTTLQENPNCKLFIPLILRSYRHHGPFQQEEGEERCRGKHCWAGATQGNINITPVDSSSRVFVQLMLTTQLIGSSQHRRAVVPNEASPPTELDPSCSSFQLLCCRL